jgi:hypothetical protein
MEQLQEIAAQMRDAVARDLGTALCLGEHKGALQHRLGVEREAFRAPLRSRRVEHLGRGNVLCNLGGVRADISVTRTADRGMRFLTLLHHGAQEAGESRYRPGEDCRAEIDIAEHAIQRIRELAIRRGTEQSLRHLGKMLGRRDRKFFLAFEVMEEGTLGQAGGGADIVHGGPRVTLGANDLHRRIEEASPRVGLCGRCAHVVRIPTGWYHVKRVFLLHKFKDIAQKADRAESTSYLGNEKRRTQHLLIADRVHFCLNFTEHWIL